MSMMAPVCLHVNHGTHCTPDHPTLKEGSPTRLPSEDFFSYLLGGARVRGHKYVINIWPVMYGSLKTVPVTKGYRNKVELN